MSPNELILNVIPCLLLIVLSWLAARQIGSWLAPSALFGLYWTGLVIITLVFAPDFPIWPGAIWSILFFGISLHLGVLIGIGFIQTRRDFLKNGVNVRYRLMHGKEILLFSLLIGGVIGFVLIRGAGYSPLTVLTNPSDILKVGSHYAQLRYLLKQPLPRSITVLYILFYVTQFFAGIWFISIKSRGSRFFALLPIAVGLFLAIIVNARTGLIWMSVFFLSGVFSMIVLNRDDAKLFNPKKVLQYVIISVLAVTFVFGIQFARERQSYSSISQLVIKTRVIMLGSLPVFSGWLQDNWDETEFNWGAKSLGGFSDIFYPDRQGTGLDWERGRIETPSVVYSPNVYTAFRQILEDLTYPGTLIAFFFIGMVVGIAYILVRGGQTTWLPILALFYAVTLSSFISNWLVYSSLALAWLLFFIVVLISRNFLIVADGSDERSSHF